jgi:GNAT superfamily N-acetyltransferase
MPPRGFHVRRFRLSDAEPVSELARQVFNEHVAHTFELEGVAEMHAHLRAEAIAERAKTHLTLLAVLSEPKTPATGPASITRIRYESKSAARVIGVIEVRHASRVSMLFVSTPHMGRGIATELMARAEAASRAAGRATMTVHSSLNAESYYRKLGFAPTDEPQKVLGFAYVPMERHLR